VKPNFLLTISPLGKAENEKENGIKVSSFPDWRWKRCDIKSLNLLPNVLARMDAAGKGANEAILVNDRGEITEGSASAFFAIRDGLLITRPLGKEILPSITRKHVLEVAKRSGLAFGEQPLTCKQAVSSEELFIAVTTKDIVPVIQFDGQTIGSGTPGPETKKLIALFKEIVH
jgi:D-alanine transaminase